MHSVLYARLQAIQQALVAAHQDRGPSAISGYVREQTIRQLILPSLPIKYRSTTGQIIDQYGGKTGQLDVIIENSMFPSIAAPSIADVRLVLAEGSVLLSRSSQLYPRNGNRFCPQETSYTLYSGDIEWEASREVKYLSGFRYSSLRTKDGTR